MNYLLEIIKENSLFIQIFIVIFATLSATYISGKLLKFYILKAGKTRNIWDDALAYALQRPVKIVILVIGFSYSIKMLDQSLNLPIFLALERIKDILIIFSLFLFILRFIKKIEQNYLALHQANQEKISTINAITKLLRISALITCVLILMHSLGINISGILAFGGVSGIAVGFAAKDLLSNFFGALMIYLDKPFKVGDWIRSPDKNIEGVVELIGWRQTKIRTFDKRPIYVPNAVFSTIVVENPSRMTHRRIYENIGVRYQDLPHIEQIITDIKNYLTNSAAVDKNQALIVNFNQFQESALDIMVYCCVFETNWIKFHELKQKILLDIAAIISQHKAEIAYPTITLDQGNIKTHS